MRLLFILLTFFSATTLMAAGRIPSEKVLVVGIDEFGIITVGRDTVGSDELARYIQERLFKSYMGTGEMHDRINFEFKYNEPTDLVVTAILKEIKEGQRKALEVLCLQKYSKNYDHLEKKKQEKLKKKFPVLFQEDFFQIPRASG